MSEGEQPTREPGANEGSTADHAIAAEPGSYEVTGQPAGLSGPAITTTERAETEPDEATWVSMEEAFRRLARDLRLADVVDYVIRFERIRRLPGYAWFLPIGLTVGGAGLGALIQSWEFQIIPLVAFLGGAGLVLAYYTGKSQETESLAVVCNDFLRFINRWGPLVEGHESNAAYAKAVLELEAKSESRLGSLRFRRGS